MKRVRTALFVTLALAGLAACDTMNSSMNDVHDTLHVEDTTKGTKFNGINGDVQSHCSPAQRRDKVCY